MPPDCSGLVGLQRLGCNSGLSIPASRVPDLWLEEKHCDRGGGESNLGGGKNVPAGNDQTGVDNPERQLEEARLFPQEREHEPGKAEHHPGEDEWEQQQAAKRAQPRWRVFIPSERQ